MKHVSINQTVRLRDGTVGTVYAREHRPVDVYHVLVGDTARTVLREEICDEVGTADTDAVALVWATPDAEAVMAWSARVSSTRQSANPDPAAFVRQAVRRGHWSVLEMASMCVRITTSLPIATQILRHRSLSFQQQSRRYDSRVAYVPSLPARLQRPRTSVGEVAADPATTAWWAAARAGHDAACDVLYHEALSRGIVREQAREVLPQSLQTTLVASGTLRSWYHYLAVRLDGHTQVEHRLVAVAIRAVLAEVAPTLAGLIGVEPD